MREKQKQYLEKKAEILQMGGQERVDKQHSRGKLTARERLDLLFDEGTFEEIGMFVQHRCVDFGMEKKKAPADGLITGFGKVNGRLVYAYAQDFTCLGGSLGEMGGIKMVRLMEEACEVGAPIVALNDGGGARIQESNDVAWYAKIFRQNVMCSGRVPQIAAIMGPCAGGSCYSPALQDFMISTRKTSKMFITGPKVIRTVTREEVDEDYFGSAEMHAKVSGCVHRVAEDDRDCIEQIKHYLSYFPQNCFAPLPEYACDQDPDALIPELDEILPESPKKGYDMHKLIELIVDKDSCYEIQPDWAKNIITTLARLNGHVIGVVANQPFYKAGCIDIDASDKMCRFVTLCSAYGIPIIYLADTPGYMPGLEQEDGGIIRHGAKALFANSSATVPRIRIDVRKVYGGAADAMCDWGGGSDYVLSWYNAECAIMGSAGAAAVVFAKEIKAAADPDAMLKEKTEEYEALFNNPYYKAKRMYTDMVIQPSETRRILIRLLETLATKKEEHPAKRCAIFPV